MLLLASVGPRSTVTPDAVSYALLRRHRLQTVLFPRFITNGFITVQLFRNQQFPPRTALAVATKPFPTPPRGGGGGRGGAFPRPGARRGRTPPATPPHLCLLFPLWGERVSRQPKGHWTPKLSSPWVCANGHVTLKGRPSSAREEVTQVATPWAPQGGASCVQWPVGG